MELLFAHTPNYPGPRGLWSSIGNSLALLRTARLS